MTIADQPLKLPVGEHNRLARSSQQCPISYCDGGPPEFLIAAQCSDGRQCPNSNSFPNDWYAMGTVQFSIQHYYHFTNSQMTCLPCCHIRSRYSKMPGCVVLFDSKFQ